jgi:hypothetical protein
LTGAKPDVDLTGAKPEDDLTGAKPEDGIAEIAFRKNSGTFFFASSKILTIPGAIR